MNCFIIQVTTTQTVSQQGVNTKFIPSTNFKFCSLTPPHFPQFPPRRLLSVKRPLANLRIPNIWLQLPTVCCLTPPPLTHAAYCINLKGGYRRALNHDSTEMELPPHFPDSLIFSNASSFSDEHPFCTRMDLIVLKHCCQI